METNWSAKWDANPKLVKFNRLFHDSNLYLRTPPASDLNQNTRIFQVNALQQDHSLTTPYWVTDFAFDFKRTQLLILEIPWYSCATFWAVFCRSAPFCIMACVYAHHLGSIKVNQMMQGMSKVRSYLSLAREWKLELFSKQCHRWPDDSGLFRS